MKNGIYIKINSSKSENQVIDDCKKLLQDTKLKARLIGLSKHDEYDGMIARFDCGPAQITELLRNKLLNDYDDTTIHSLTTALAIENAFPIAEDYFVLNLQEQIQNMAPVRVLGISKVPVSPKHPDVNSGRWIMTLDTPEVDELLVFERMGLPDRMVLASPVDGGDLRVRFYCRLCNKNGHIQWRCLKDDSSVRSTELPSESPRKKARIDGSDPCCSQTSNGESSRDEDDKKGSFGTISYYTMPEDIKNLVTQIGSSPFSVDQLEAYINLVQDKPDPAGFAIRFYHIKDIVGLREQMSKISRRFYVELSLFSVANMRFMRLLQNVLERLPGGHA